MTHKLTHQWRACIKLDFRVRDFGGNHGFENGRFALDDKVTPALQLAELIEATLDEDAVTAAQDGLPAG
jgi:surfactin synthase thioesterase subunit